MATLFQVSTHRLVRLHELKTLRAEILQQCKRAAVKGDVLLSAEGFCLHLVGERSSLEEVLAGIHAHAGLEKISWDFTVLGYVPYSRIRVRIKNELRLDERMSSIMESRSEEENRSAQRIDVRSPVSGHPPEQLLSRHHSIQQHTTPLPGSIPYDNYRPLRVPPACDEYTLLEFLCDFLPHVPNAEWRARIDAGLLLDTHHEVMSSTDRVRRGERYFHLYPNTIEPDVNPQIQILYEDDAIVVVDKPAPLPLHPSGRFNRNTLQSILQRVYDPAKLRPAHRLDANTTGIIVFSRTKRMAGNLQKQFENGSVQKTYLAKVFGHPPQDNFRCDVPISKNTGPVGNRSIDPRDGLSALTEFSVIKRNNDGNALVKAVPLTGRTNQIRIHLWALGLPICGDPVYRPGQTIGTVQTLPVEAEPLCLHAWKLSFRHPANHAPLLFVAQAPKWATSTLGESTS